MKEYYDDNVKVVEYGYEDWEEGIISGNWKPGKELVKGAEGKERHYQYLPIDQYQLIEEERKKLYWKKVESKFTHFKKAFEKRYFQSGNPKMLLEQELHNFSQLFAHSTSSNAETNNHTILGRNLTSIKVWEYRNIYKRVVIEGARNYQFTNSPNCKVKIGAGDTHFIIVESYAKYYEWIENFHPNSLLLTSTDFRLECLNSWINQNSSLSVNEQAKLLNIKVKHYPSDYLPQITVHITHYFQDWIEQTQELEESQQHVELRKRRVLIRLLIEYNQQIDEFLHEFSREELEEELYFLQQAQDELAKLKEILTITGRERSSERFLRKVPFDSIDDLVEYIVNFSTLQCDKYEDNLQKKLNAFPSMKINTIEEELRECHKNFSAPPHPMMYPDTSIRDTQSLTKVFDEVSQLIDTWQGEDIKEYISHIANRKVLLDKIDLLNWLLKDQGKLSNNVIDIKQNTDRSTKVVKAEFKGLKPDNIEAFYQSRLQSWMLSNSDKVWVNGRELKPMEKVLLASGVEFKPTPETIKADYKSGGFDLTEKDFIEYEMEQIDSYPKVDLPTSKKLSYYLDFIKNRTILKIESKGSQPNLPLRVIALLHFYQNEPITKENSVTISQKHGHKGSTKL